MFRARRLKSPTKSIFITEFRVNKMRQMLAAFLLTVLTVNFLQSELIKFYKKGTIPLNSSPGFGKNVDWHSLFYDTLKEIAVAPDGSIFKERCQANFSLSRLCGRECKAHKTHKTHT